VPEPSRNPNGARARLAAVAAVALAVALTACSAGGSGGGAAAEPPGPAPATTAPAAPAARPPGPAAVINGPLTAGRGVAMATRDARQDPTAGGYSQQEYTASGTATAYRAPGGLPADGAAVLEPGPSAPYRTRVLVQRPADPVRFSGTVVVEWLNDDTGIDAAPEQGYLGDELRRQGHAWVGVSAQRIGVEGGPVAVAIPGTEGLVAAGGIKGADPDRYGTLAHPGDAFADDIFTQVARALRTAGGGVALTGLPVRQLLAAGQSQGAFALTTYINGVQPLTRAFDGFLLHSRAGGTQPLGEPGAIVDVAATIVSPPTRLRADRTEPVIVLQTESDVLGVLNYFPARQPDDAHLRVWEVAGSAHADKVQMGSIENVLGCATPVNRGQQGYVLRAALRHLRTWAAGGPPPPSAPPLATSDDGGRPVYVTDAVGNVQGGVRTPAVDAPVDVLSGLGRSESSVICQLSGSTVALGPAALAARWPDREDYVRAYAKAADDAIAAGFVLADDRTELIAEAQPERLSG
jgi:hypothetical protein